MKYRVNLEKIEIDKLKEMAKHYIDNHDKMAFSDDEARQSDLATWKGILKELSRKHSPNATHKKSQSAKTASQIKSDIAKEKIEKQLNLFAMGERDNSKSLTINEVVKSAKVNYRTVKKHENRIAHYNNNYVNQ
jgi:hypothetical protein